MILEHADDEAFQDFQSVGRVMMRLDSRSLDERIATVEEFADVSTIVLSEDKLTARVKPFVALQVEYQVVKDEERHARDHSFVNLLARESQDVIAFLGLTIRRNHSHISLAIGVPVEALKDHDDQAESAQTE